MLHLWNTTKRHPTRQVIAISFNFIAFNTDIIDRQIRAPTFGTGCGGSSDNGGNSLSYIVVVAPTTATTAVVGYYKNSKTKLFKCRSPFFKGDDANSLPRFTNECRRRWTDIILNFVRPFLLASRHFKLTP